MFRPRIIPVLLIENEAAIQTKGFKKTAYLGDVINTARLFAEMQADELILLDVTATSQQRSISAEMVKEISEETTMPIAVGGGVFSLQQIEHLTKNGAEKIVVGKSAIHNLNFLKEAIVHFGSSTISACLDVDQNKYIRGNRGEETTNIHILDQVQTLNEIGIGEIIIQSIENDGMRNGYDLNLIQAASRISKVPIVALGGANMLNDFKLAYKYGATACAASTMFTMFKNGVLINYLDKSEKKSLSVDL